jgi:hypothetical protein
VPGKPLHNRCDGQASCNRICGPVMDAKRPWMPRTLSPLASMYNYLLTTHLHTTTLSWMP